MRQSQDHHFLVLIVSVLLLIPVFTATPVHGADLPSATPTTASDSVKSIFDSADGVTFGGAVLAVCAMLGGVTMCLAGFKLFHLTLFALSFTAGGTLLAIIAEKVFASESWLLTASWIAFIVGGLLCGFLVTSIYSTGIFLAGAMGGVLLAAVVNTSFGYKVYPSNPEIALIILAVVFGVLGGVLAMRLEKPVLICATSFVGAGLLVWGVGYFAGEYPSATDLKRYRTSSANGGEDDDWEYHIPSAWWVYLCGTLLIACAGVLIQFKLTERDLGRADDHDNNGSTLEANAVAPRKRVVMFARRDVIEEEDLGTPKTSDLRSGYAIAQV